MGMGGIPFRIGEDRCSTRRRLVRSAANPLPIRGATGSIPSCFDNPSVRRFLYGMATRTHPWVRLFRAIMHILCDHFVIDNHPIAETDHFLQTFAGQRLA